jgi:hypothetical protein
MMDLLLKDGIPLLEALKAKGYALRIEIVSESAGRKDDRYETYDVKFTFPRKHDTPPAVPGGELVPDGVDPDRVQNGKISLYAVVNMMTQLNVSTDALQKLAFAMLVIKEKVKRGEQADWADPKRPAQETFEDVDLALKLVAAHRRDTQIWRAQVLAVVALAVAYDGPQGKRALSQQIAEQRATAQKWQATHHQPALEDFGVAAATLPTPDKMLDDLNEQMGFMGVLQVATGVVTGSPQATLEGLSRLAPKDSSARIALQGLAAAGGGDVKGAIDAVAKLTGHDQEVRALEQRLKEVEANAQALR